MEDRLDAVDAWTALGLPLYGLPPSDGRLRWVTSFSASVPWIALGHGEPDAPDRVDVGEIRRAHSVFAGSQPRIGERRVGITSTLATQLLFGRYRLPNGADAQRRWTIGMNERAAAASWAPSTLNIDAKQLSGYALVEDGHWIAFAEVGPVWVYAHSRGSPLVSVELVPVSDRSGYATLATA